MTARENNRTWSARPKRQSRHNVRLNEVLPYLESKIEQGVAVYSDEHQVYKNLRKLGYKHETISYAAGEYVRGDVYTKSLEGFWSQIKRSLNGTH